MNDILFIFLLCLSENNENFDGSNVSNDLLILLGSEFNELSWTFILIVEFVGFKKVEFEVVLFFDTNVKYF